MRTTVVRASVRFVPVYECVKCGATESGSTISKIVEATSFEEVAMILSTYRLCSSNMPIGWQCWFNQFICSRHA